MAWLVQLSSVVGLSLTAGINLYATVAVVGLVTRFELIRGLPPEFQAFNNDVVIAVALILYACEFLADKIPAFDSVWDSVHTFIRPFGAALIAMTVVGEAAPAVEILAGMLGASLGLATHAAKAGARLVANTSPEPFSNVALSLGEDVAVVGASVLVMSNPLVSLAVSVVFLVLLIWFGPELWRSAILVVRAVPARLLSLFRGADASPTTFLPDAVQEVVDSALSEGELVRASRRCHARKVRGCGWNKPGYLVLTDRRLLFVHRRWLSIAVRDWSLDRLDRPEVRQRLLVDVLRVKHDGRFVNFVFLKHRPAPAVRLAELLEAAVAGNRTRETGEDARRIVPLAARGERTA